MFVQLGIILRVVVKQHPAKIWIVETIQNGVMSLIPVIIVYAMELADVLYQTAHNHKMDPTVAVSVQRRKIRERLEIVPTERVALITAETR